jgi:hypothetical protein
MLQTLLWFSHPLYRRGVDDMNWYSQLNSISNINIFGLLTFGRQRLDTVAYIFACDAETNIERYVAKAVRFCICIDASG